MDINKNKANVIKTETQPGKGYFHPNDPIKDTIPE